MGQIEYYTNIDLKLNEIKNVVIDTVATKPTPTKAGQMLYSAGELWVSKASGEEFVWKQIAIGEDVSGLTTRVTKLEEEVGIDSTGTATGSGLKKKVTDIETWEATAKTEISTLQTEVETTGTGLLSRVKAIEDAPYLAGTKVESITDGQTNAQFPTAPAVKTYVDTKVTAVLRYKGSLASLNDLPTTGVQVGDTYNIQSKIVQDEKVYPAGTNVACSSTNPLTWDPLGGTIDASKFELVDYKSQSITTDTGSATKYPSVVAVETELAKKQDNITGAATTIVSKDLDRLMAVVSDNSGKVAVSSVTSTELGYVSGVTSAIQTQMDTKYEFANITTTTDEGSATKSTVIYSKLKADELLATKVDRETDKRLMTDAEGTKLAGIAGGAQVNVIETVKVDGTALTVTDKAVNIDLSGKVDKTTKVNGHALSADVTVSANDVGLGLVVNKGMDSAVTSASENYVSSGAVYTALTDGTVTKVGTTTVGSATQPMYLNLGVPTAITGAIANDTTGNAGTATKLASAKTIALSGAVTGTATAFDGSANITIDTTAVDPTKITAGQIGSSSVNVTLYGNAGSATKLANARDFSITGGATASAVSFDGTGAVELSVTELDASKLTAGVAPVSAIPDLNASKITAGILAEDRMYLKKKTVAISGTSATISEFPYGLLVLDNTGKKAECAVTFSNGTATLEFSESFTGTAYYIGINTA